MHTIQLQIHKGFSWLTFYETKKKKRKIYSDWFDGLNCTWLPPPCLAGVFSWLCGLARNPWGIRGEKKNHVIVHGPDGTLMQRNHRGRAITK